MKSRPHKSTIVALAAGAVLALPAVAGATPIDYSMNAATGHHPAAGNAPAQTGPKDYSKNAVDGTYAPDETPSVEVVTVADDGGFAWDDAAIGAGVALVLALTALGATVVIRRRRTASPAA
jgi:hypothetical protein